MKSIKTLTIGLLSTGFLLSCGGGEGGTHADGTDTLAMGLPDTNAVVDGHNAANALDYFGTYTGVLPCADCEGIETTLVINPDTTYLYMALYQRQNPTSFTERGKWRIDESTLYLDNIETPFFVGENHLIQLDVDGNRIEGALAENYRLRKQ